ncbi:MAG: hypothetical protein M1821_003361 [Bathelium mastoideum]|nr:MAG: hypothetical protein M1821_003361 [Bathelium mastoideum]KAI9686084.1 MAG: hypothetical protein M1822_004067 [Bathelium mastoideum]
MVATRSQATHSKKEETSPESRSSRKHAREEEHSKPVKKTKPRSSPAHKNETAPKSEAKSTGSNKIDNILRSHPDSAPTFNALKDPQKPTPETVLAHLLNALISSARISHTIAAGTLEKVLSAGYHNIGTLAKSSWEERTEVLTEGGYAHYREKTATAMGDMANYVSEKYDGDVSRLVEGESSDKTKGAVMKRVKEFKGIGQLGAEIFLETIQAVAPHLAPVLSKRNSETAEKLGLGDADSIFEQLHNDACSMAKLSQALTVIRLEGTVDKFT